YRPVLGGGIGIKDAVWDICPAARRQILLLEMLGPAQPRQHAPDQIVLGLGFVRGLAGREPREDRVEVAANCLKLLVVKRGPVRIACDGPLDEVVREEAPLICTRRQTVPLQRLSHGSHSAYAALQEP